MKKDYNIDESDLTLYNEIEIIKLEKYIRELSTASKYEKKIKLKKFLNLSLPFTLLSTIAFIFNNNYFLIAGIGSFSIASINYFIKEIKEMNKMDKTTDNVIMFNESKSVEQILQNGIDKRMDEDFYTEDFKNSVETLEYIFEDNLEQTDSKSELWYHNMQLNKEKCINELINELDFYDYAYNLPKIRISDFEFDTFYNHIYELFLKKGIELDFYYYMSIVMKFTLSYALIYNSKKVSILDFINNLWYLNTDDFNEKEILKLQKELCEKLSCTKVLDFQNKESILIKE